MATGNFQINKMYVFKYALYEQVIRSKGFKPSPKHKLYDGEIFTAQSNTNYIILRRGIDRITVDPRMCELKEAK